MWLDCVKWFLSLLMFLLNFWLAISIFKSKEVNKIYLFLLMYFLILHDLLYYIVTFVHNIPSYFQPHSIFKNKPFLIDISVVILSCQWFFHLFFLPVFSLLHFFALFFPLWFRRFNHISITCIIVCLYILTAVVTIPLLTSCCGFVYYEADKYWFFDFQKPYTYVYYAINNWLQAICVMTMIVSNVAIVIKLILIRKPSSVIRNQSVIAISSSQRIETDVTGTTTSSYTRWRSRIWGPEVRLGVSFVLLSGCWICSTLCFNLLQGNNEILWAIVNLLSDYLNKAKWIVYCLGNRNIQKVFYSPLKSFTS